MTSERTKRLQAECERISRKQWGAKGERYIALDRQWSRVAVALNRSRLHDAVPCRLWLRNRLA